MTVSASSVTIRPATPDDVPTIFALIQALADYENLAHEVVGSETALGEHLFGDRPYITSMLADVEGHPAGFTLFFPTYVAAQGLSGYYLEDLFVSPDYRRLGLGKALLRALAHQGLEHHCPHLTWSVLDWNQPAIAFYQRIGAHVHPDHRIGRVTGDGLQRWAERPVAESGYTTRLLNGPEALMALTALTASSEAVGAADLPHASDSPNASEVEGLLVEAADQPVALAFFFHNYSTFLTQPGLFVEALCVAPDADAPEVVALLYQRLAQMAVERRCGRLEWLMTSEDPEAIAQIEAQGGVVLPDWRICRMQRGAIATLANGG